MSLSAVNQGAEVLVKQPLVKIMIILPRKAPAGLLNSVWKILTA